MIKIEHVEAVRYNKIMSAGRTSPLLLACERVDGSEIDVVVKFATGRECKESSLCAELIASQLAADLALPTPKPLIVNWDGLFTEVVPDDQARKIVASSLPPAFGSTFVTGGFVPWSHERKLMNDGMRQVALGIFFFDAMIGNADRRKEKPNLLVRGEQFRLIDHELAFRDFSLFIKPAPPWDLGALGSLETPGVHILASELVKYAKELKKEGKELDFGSIRGLWAGLSNGQIEGYEAALPPNWIEDRQLAAFAVQRIKDCRDHIDDCVMECRRVLNVGT